MVGVNNHLYHSVYSGIFRGSKAGTFGPWTLPQKMANLDCNKPLTWQMGRKRGACVPESDGRRCLAVDHGVRVRTNPVNRAVDRLLGI